MITELADQNGDGIMTLEELAEYLHVSMATVRRDVDELASRGVLQKTRRRDSSGERGGLAGSNVCHAPFSQYG